MGIRLKAYPEYKDSGLPWLGKIPAHWDKCRLKYLLREVNVRSSDGAERLLSVSQYTGITPRHSREGQDEPETRAETLAGYKQVLPNDLVVNIMLAWNGSLGISQFVGIVSPAYCVYRLRGISEPGYYHHLLRSPIYKGRIKTASTGVVESRLRLYSDALFRIEALIPSKQEQSTIASFVEVFNRKVDRLIRTKRRLIDLLNEQKAAIINSIVTRGLKLDIPMKPSKIEWLGEIPTHWEVWQIGHFAKVGNGSTPLRGNSRYWADAGYPWLNSASVNQVKITSADQFVTDEAMNQCHLPRVSPGSLLVAITGQGKTRGKAAILQIESTINQHLAYITPRTLNVSSEFLHLQLIGAYAKLREISEDAGSTKGALTCEDLKHFHVALPPLGEQIQIVTLLRKEVQELEEAISRINREISLIREYRTRLIADVVTGKLDVRGIELPEMEEADDIMLLDDVAIDDAPEEMEDLELIGEDNYVDD